MFKLVYVKDGKIHMKKYAILENMEMDLDILHRHPYPVWVLASDDDEEWSVMDIVNLRTCWHRVPECRWPKEFLKAEDGFTGRRFDYSPRLNVYCFYKHGRTMEGYDMYYHVVMDMHGNAFTYTTYGR